MSQRVQIQHHKRPRAQRPCLVGLLEPDSLVIRYLDPGSSCNCCYPLTQLQNNPAYAVSGCCGPLVLRIMSSSGRDFGIDSTGHVAQTRNHKYNVAYCGPSVFLGSFQCIYREYVTKLSMSRTWIWMDGIAYTHMGVPKFIRSPQSRPKCTDSY